MYASDIEKVLQEIEEKDEGAIRKKKKILKIIKKCCKDALNSYDTSIRFNKDVKKALTAAQEQFRQLKTAELVNTYEKILKEQMELLKQEQGLAIELEKSAAVVKFLKVQEDNVQNEVKRFAEMLRGQYQDVLMLKRYVEAIEDPSKGKDLAGEGTFSDAGNIAIGKDGMTQKGAAQFANIRGWIVALQKTVHTGFFTRGHIQFYLDEEEKVLKKEMKETETAQKYLKKAA